MVSCIEVFYPIWVISFSKIFLGIFFWSCLLSFCLIFWRYKDIVDFIYLDLLYLVNQQFLAIWFALYLCPILCEVLILFDGFVCFKIFWNIVLKRYGFSSLFLLIFAVKFSFLILLTEFLCLKYAKHLLEYFFSHFLDVQTKNLFFFILIFFI